MVAASPMLSGTDLRHPRRAIPFAITIVISFMKWNAAYPDDIGFGTLRNYITVFTNADLLRAVFVTVGLTVSVVLVSAVLGLAIALPPQSQIDRTRIRAHADDGPGS